MKVGIITFHYNNNFGAALQCYALQRVIHEMGHDADVIDYVPKDGELKPFWRGWNIRSGQFLKTFRQRFLQLKYGRRASRAFNAFRRTYFTLSPRCSSIEDVQRVASQYDAVVCGSDQVWVFDRPSAYFLDLGEQFEGIKISYAACCGHDRQRTDKDDEIKRLLAEFNSISVRNDFSKEIISPLTDKTVSVVADPTLLVDFADIMQERPLSCSDYILMYALSESPAEDQRRIISSIRKKFGDLPVVSIVANSCPRRSALAQYNIFDASPRQWVWLIAHASFVYTDSFHGTLFCVKHSRPFIADYKETWRSLRLLDIASRYGFEGCIANSADDAVEKIEDMDFNFSAMQKLIGSHADISFRFLSKALSP